MKSYDEELDRLLEGWQHTLLDAKWEYLSAHRDEYDPGKLDVFVRDATRKAVMHWMDKLGCEGKA